MTQFWDRVSEYPLYTAAASAVDDNLSTWCTRGFLQWQTRYERIAIALWIYLRTALLQLLPPPQRRLSLNAVTRSDSQSCGWSTCSIHNSNIYNTRVLCATFTQIIIIFYYCLSAEQYPNPTPPRSIATPRLLCCLCLKGQQHAGVRKIDINLLFDGLLTNAERTSTMPRWCWYCKILIKFYSIFKYSSQGWSENTLAWDEIDCPSLHSCSTVSSMELVSFTTNKSIHLIDTGN